MHGIKENKKRFGNLCLPTSVNASVIELKRLSRRVKLEIKRNPMPTQLTRTWMDINKVLQRIRQLESDHIAIEKFETNVGRKRYQSSLIAKDKVNYDTLVVASKSMPKSIKSGYTVAVGDTWKNFYSIHEASYVVVAIGVKGDENEIEFDRFSSNTYMITLREKLTERDPTKKDRIITITAGSLFDRFFLHDVSFFDTDFTPNYCESCDTYQESWANNGGFNL